MGDIYATPEADLAQPQPGNRDGGNVDDAIAGNIEIGVFDILGEAWRELKGFKLKCHIATVLWFVVYLVASLISIPIVIGLSAVGAGEGTATLLAWIVQIVAIAATMPMIVGITVMGIRHHRGKSVSPSQVFAYFHKAPVALLWYILMTLMIMLGYLLLILPGIYLSIAYLFSLPLLVEKDMSAWRALETSRKTLNHFWFRGAGFLILIMLLIVLGTIPLGIPLIWIVPWTSLAFSIMYFKLFGAEAQTLAD